MDDGPTRTKSRTRGGVLGFRRSADDGPSGDGDDVSTTLGELDSQLAALLADDAEVLACDGTLEPPSARLAPEVRARLIEARECLGMLRRALPRGVVEAIEPARGLAEARAIPVEPSDGRDADPGRAGTDCGRSGGSRSWASWDTAASGSSTWRTTPRSAGRWP